jgi:TolB protein
MKSKLRLLTVCTGLIVIINNPVFSQQKKEGIFEGYEDIGTVSQRGSTTFNSLTNEYELSSFGSDVKNIGASHFAWKRLKGDFILYARVSFATKESNANCRIGWMIRGNLKENSSQINAGVNTNGVTSINFRRREGDTTLEILSEISHADVVQLERKDSTYIVRVARFGDPFFTKQISGLNLPDEVYIGLYVCSNGAPGSGIFRDVHVTIPVDENLALVRKDVGSNLEILDIETANRKILYTDSNSIHAPIWKKDGKTLIYGRQGGLYTFDIETKNRKVINTDGMQPFYNDHVLSPDGKTLAVCIKPNDSLDRVIYTLPVTGGTPNRINDKGPSYPHSWSPDGKFILYTSSRNGEFDIYKIPSTGKGKEIRLTNARGRDDSPEYTPDGKYIYFNSNRTGTMLLWRMKADGSKQEAMTRGEFQDWFPHISPDAKWIVFLSYSKEDVSSGGNPYYKHAYLRLMPISGGKPKIIAYIYGGNGTINSPCWSADSKKITFASNTDIAQ